MPILEVEVVLRQNETLPAGVAAAIADAAAQVFGSSPGNTWVRLRTMSPRDYAEDGGGPPEGVFPVFVSVLKARIGNQEELQREAARLTEVIAGAVGRPAENVHLQYQPPGMGRVSFGGHLRTE